MPSRAHLTWLILALPLAGCGGRGGYKTAPVSGRVTLDNKPLPNASVTFVPKSDAPANERPPPSVGVTDDDGRYTLTVNDNTKADGAVVGKHDVTILLTALAGAHDVRPTFHQHLPERYDRKSELPRDAPAAGRNDARFDLQSR